MELQELVKKYKSGIDLKTLVSELNPETIQLILKWDDVLRAGGEIGRASCRERV